MSALILGGILAAGAGIGALSTWRQGKREKAALERQKESAWMQYLLGRQYGDAQFSLQKSEALEELGVQRQNLNTQMGLATDDFNTGLLGQAFGIQDARIENESAAGMSLAAEGAGGTRGNAANGLVRAYAARSLERNIELQDRQNSGYLNRMVTGATMTSQAIERERESWMPGGYRARQKEAQDWYNLNMANLGLSDFDWQIEHAKPGFLDYFTGMMGGASSGMSMGIGVSKFKDAWNGTGKEG